MKAQNLDKLTQEQQDMIALYFTMPIMFWPNHYMIEVRLDDPSCHLLKGGDGLVTHGGDGSRCYARHYGDDNWAVVHNEDEDVRDWDVPAMAERAMDAVEELQNEL